MASLRLVVRASLALACLALAPVAQAEMYKYVDRQGRMHFTQDIGQVPPEYRAQVERKVLKKEISITGEGRGAPGDEDRVRAMEKRKRKLEHAARKRNRKAGRASAPAVRRNRHPLEGAPEPRKYDRECDWNYSTHQKRCRRILRDDWRRWDQANGGQNGKRAIRRRVGDP